MEDAAVLTPVRSPQELLREFRETGRQAPFEEIVRRYAGMVFHTCLQVTKNAHDAEDVTQAVFLTLAVQCKTEKTIHAIGPWLQQVAHRLALDLRKSKKRRVAREEKHSMTWGGGTEPEASRQLDVDELKHLLNEELNNLPPKYRLPLILHYYGGLSREEMAKELNCKPSTLGVRLFRGREMLGNRLASRGITLSGSVLTAALTYCIQSSVSDGLVLSTSHAATVLAAGHEPMAGLISAQVLSMSRGAMGAMAMARFKTLAVVVLLTGSTMAAGAQVVSRVVPGDWKLQNFIPQLKLRISPPPIQSPLPSFSLTAVTPEPLEIVPSTPIYGEFPLIASANAGILNLAPLSLEIREGRAAVVATGPLPAQSPGPVENLAVDASRRIDLMAQPVRLAGAEATREIARPQFRAGEFALVAPSPSGGDAPQPEESASTFRAMRTDVAGASSESAVAIARGDLLLVPAPAPIEGHRAGPMAGFVRIAPPDDGLPADADVAFALSPLPRRTAASPLSGDRDVWIAAAALNSSHNGIDLNPGPFEEIAIAAGPSRRGHRNSWSIDGERLEGWGRVLLGGALDVSGQVIADGRGADRTLDLSYLPAILNTLDNAPNGGVNGWYAMRGGRLTLPSLYAEPGMTSLTWGENPGDSVLDLVNSVRITFSEPLDAGGTIQMSLLSPDRRDVPLLDDGRRVLGLWSIQSNGVPLDDFGLMVRYDDLQARAMGSWEHSLQLWGYDGGWRPLLDGFWLDSDANLIAARASGISLFAVTGGRPTAVSGPSLSLPGTSNSAVPEPAALLLGVGLGMLLLRRRRTR